MSSVGRRVKRALGALIVLALAVSGLPTAAAATEPSAKSYQFANAFGTGGELRVVGDISAAPITSKQSYGACRRLPSGNRAPSSSMYQPRVST